VPAGKRAEEAVADPANDWSLVAQRYSERDDAQLAHLSRLSRPRLFIYRSSAAFLARPDTLHGARGKYDPATGIRQEHRRGNQSKSQIAKSNILAPGTLLGLDRYSDSRLVLLRAIGWSALLPRKPARDVDRGKA
jgi:hypothetical protein